MTQDGSDLHRTSSAGVIVGGSSSSSSRAPPSEEGGGDAPVGPPARLRIGSDKNEPESGDLQQDNDGPRCGSSPGEVTSSSSNRMNSSSAGVQKLDSIASSSAPPGHRDHHDGGRGCDDSRQVMNHKSTTNGTRKGGGLGWHPYLFGRGPRQSAVSKENSVVAKKSTQNTWRNMMSWGHTKSGGGGGEGRNGNNHNSDYEFEIDKMDSKVSKINSLASWDEEQNDGDEGLRDEQRHVGNPRNKTTRGPQTARKNVGRRRNSLSYRVRGTVRNTVMLMKTTLSVSLHTPTFYGPQYSFVWTQVNLVLPPLLLVSLWILLKAVLHGDVSSVGRGGGWTGCEYTTADLKWALVELSGGALHVADPELADAKDVEFFAPVLQHYLFTDLSLAPVGVAGIVWATAKEMWNIWSKRSQFAYTIIVATPVLVTQTLSYLHGNYSLVAPLGLLVLIFHFFSLTLLKPCRIPMHLSLYAAASTSLFVVHAKLGIFYVDSLLKPAVRYMQSGWVDADAAEDASLFTDAFGSRFARVTAVLVELVLTGFFFSVWVPFGSKLQGPVMVRTTLAIHRYLWEHDREIVLETCKATDLKSKLGTMKNDEDHVEVSNLEVVVDNTDILQQSETNATLSNGGAAEDVQVKLESSCEGDPNTASGAVVAKSESSPSSAAAVHRRGNSVDANLQVGHNSSSASSVGEAVDHAGTSEELTFPATARKQATLHSQPPLNLTAPPAGTDSSDRSRSASTASLSQQHQPAKTKRMEDRESLDSPFYQQRKIDLENFCRPLVNTMIDMYRYAYGRGILLGLSPAAFVLIVAKEMIGDMTHFGIGYFSSYQIFLLKLQATVNQAAAQDEESGKLQASTKQPCPEEKDVSAATTTCTSAADAAAGAGSASAIGGPAIAVVHDESQSSVSPAAAEKSCEEGEAEAEQGGLGLGDEQNSPGKPTCAAPSASRTLLEVEEATSPTSAAARDVTPTLRDDDATSAAVVKAQPTTIMKKHTTLSPTKHVRTVDFKADTLVDEVEIIDEENDQDCVDDDEAVQSQHTTGESRKVFRSKSRLARRIISKTSTVRSLISVVSWKSWTSIRQGFGRTRTVQSMYDGMTSLFGSRKSCFSGCCRWRCCPQPSQRLRKRKCYTLCCGRSRWNDQDPDDSYFSDAEKAEAELRDRRNRPSHWRISIFSAPRSKDTNSNSNEGDEVEGEASGGEQEVKKQPPRRHRRMLINKDRMTGDFWRTLLFDLKQVKVRYRVLAAFELLLREVEKLVDFFTVTWVYEYDDRALKSLRAKKAAQLFAEQAPDSSPSQLVHRVSPAPVGFQVGLLRASSTSPVVLPGSGAWDHRMNAGAQQLESAISLSTLAPAAPSTSYSSPSVRALSAIEQRLEAPDYAAKPWWKKKVSNGSRASTVSGRSDDLLLAARIPAKTSKSDSQQVHDHPEGVGAQPSGGSSATSGETSGVAVDKTETQHDECLSRAGSSTARADRKRSTKMQKLSTHSKQFFARVSRWISPRRARKSTLWSVSTEKLIKAKQRHNIHSPALLWKRWRGIKKGVDSGKTVETRKSNDKEDDHALRVAGKQCSSSSAVLSMQSTKSVTRMVSKTVSTRLAVAARSTLKQIFTAGTGPTYASVKSLKSRIETLQAQASIDREAEDDVEDEHSDIDHDENGGQVHGELDGRSPDMLSQLSPAEQEEMTRMNTLRNASESGGAVRELNRVRSIKRRRRPRSSKGGRGPRGESPTRNEAVIVFANHCILATNLPQVASFTRGGSPTAGTTSTQQTDRSSNLLQEEERPHERVVDHDVETQDDVRKVDTTASADPFDDSFALAALPQRIPTNPPSAPTTSRVVVSGDGLEDELVGNCLFPVVVKGELDSLQRFIEYVQSEIFVRFQMRAAVRFFTCGVLVVSGLLGMCFPTSIAKLPGYPRGDASLYFRSQVLTLFVVDVVTYLVLTFAIHLNERISLKPWRFLLGEYMAVWNSENIPRGEIKARRFFLAFGFYFGTLMVSKKWEPYSTNALVSQTNLPSLSLDHVAKACKEFAGVSLFDWGD